MRILFVCTGNINRSAAAEFLARRDYTGWEVRSAAMNLKAGRVMAPRMRQLLGVERETAPRSVAMSQELADWADLVVGFQPSHDMAATYGKPYRRITDWLSGVKKVPDPHFDSSGVTHVLVLDMIKIALLRMHRELRHCVCCSPTCSAKPDSCRCHWYEDPIYEGKIEPGVVVR